MPVIERVQTKSNNKVKVLAIALVAIVLLSIVAVISISIYVGTNLTKPDRKIITQFPDEFGLVYEDVTFISLKDELLLSGWWIPSQEDGNEVESAETVIFAHGYRDVRTQEKISVLQLAQRLANEGYNILLFDFRASGKSEGNLTTIGQFEKDDLLAATHFVKEEMGSQQISIVGWSMGAVSAILAMIDSDDVQLVIADSPFADLKEYLEENLPYWSGLPSFPFTPLIINIIPYLSGIEADQVSPYRAVGNLGENRLLLIHSKGDEPIPYSNSERIYDSASNKEQVEVWLTEEGGHIESFLTDQLEYEERVLAFLRK